MPPSTSLDAVGQFERVLAYTMTCDSQSTINLVFYRSHTDLVCSERPNQEPGIGERNSRCLLRLRYHTTRLSIVIYLSNQYR